VDRVIHYDGGGGSLTTGERVVWYDAFEAPLISTILPRYLHLGLNRSKSRVQSVLDLWRQKRLGRV